MIGEYMARIYMEVKNRPIYFAREMYMMSDIVHSAEEKQGEICAEQDVKKE